MIDLHCHYLPCVDDGAQTVAEALQLARAAVANGIRHAALTPHIHPGRYENKRSTLEPRVQAFRRALELHAIPLEVHLAGEVRFGMDSFELAATDELPYLGGWDAGKVILFEFTPGQLPVGAVNAATMLRAAGIVPMIAHPERNKEVMRDWRRFAALVKEGCLVQITAGSILGHFGSTAKRVADEMLNAGWVTVVATDAHNVEHRPPVLAEARAALTERFGGETATQLVERNPARILGLADELLSDSPQAAPEHEPSSEPARSAA